MSARWLITALLATTAVMATSPAFTAQPYNAEAPPAFLDQSKGFTPSSSLQPSLADLLTRSKRTKLFYDYVRDSIAVSTLLIDPLGSATLLAPTDQAILALARKPHEGPATAAAAGQIEEERSRAEWLDRWVKMHVILDRVELEDGDWEEREYKPMVGSSALRFVRSGEHGKGRVVLPANVEIVGEEQALNGKILYLQGTLD
ncbi:hypothetical protein JCM11641_008009 [Rhodosporidiobolus odoratus]